MAIDANIQEIYNRLVAGETIRIAVDKPNHLYLRNAISMLRFRNEKKWKQLGIPFSKLSMRSSYDSNNGVLTMRLVEISPEQEAEEYLRKQERRNFQILDDDDSN